MVLTRSENLDRCRARNMKGWALEIVVFYLAIRVILTRMSMTKCTVEEIFFGFGQSLKLENRSLVENGLYIVRSVHMWDLKFVEQEISLFNVHC